MVLKQWFCSLFFSKRSEYYFPEEILIQILCRIPVDRVLLFKRVCRRWKSIISSPLFVNLHTRHLRIQSGQPLNHHKSNHISILVVFNKFLYMDRLGIFEGELGFGLTGKLRRNMGIRKKRLTCSILEGSSFSDLLLDSIDGLLVFDLLDVSRGSTEKHILILNPMTKKTRVIKYPVGDVSDYVCAFFFDRLRQQHNLLHVSTKTRVYHIFSLTETAWRRIQITDTTPSSSLARANLVPPCLHINRPVIVGDTLHWLVDDYEPNERRGLYRTVMALKIQSNKVHYIRLPITPAVTPTGHASGHVIVTDCVYVCHSTYRYSPLERMQLIEHKGKLCFCHIVLHSGAFELWSFDECSWVKRFKFNLPKISPWCRFRASPKKWGPLILSFPHKDIVAIKWTKGIYLYNLGTHKACRIKDGDKCVLGPFRFTAFNKTLVSPNIA